MGASVGLCDQRGPMDPDPQVQSGKLEYHGLILPTLPRRTWHNCPPVCLQGDREHEKQKRPRLRFASSQSKGWETTGWRLLKLRGVAVFKIPAPKPRKEGTFRWYKDPLTGPDADNAQSATWYTDGSLLMNNWATLRCIGFGVVVVSNEGKLLGYGYGSPPSRIATAAAAELWAIDFVISVNAFPPKMKTDCMSILTSARGRHDCGHVRVEAIGEALAQHRRKHRHRHIDSAERWPSSMGARALIHQGRRREAIAGRAKADYDRLACESVSRPSRQTRRQC